MNNKILVVLLLLTVGGLIGLPTTLATVSDMFKDKSVVHLSGENEVPPVDTKAIGNAIFKLNKNKTELSYKLIAANIENVTMSHIHLGAAGTNGPVVAWLYPSAPPPMLISGEFNGVLASGTITEANLVGPFAGQPFNTLIKAMEAGNTYVNIHTSQYPGGEIRGQLQFKEIPHKQIDRIGLKLVVEGLTAPVGLVSPEDKTDRLFIVDQIGIIRILTKDGVLLDEPFLNLSSRIVDLRSGFDERGLLGLAFHPDYKKNGRFFVYYSAPLREGAPSDWNHTSHISEFKISKDDPNKADLSSERLLLQIDEPQFNHNAGQIAFGPDGYLYIPLGDGGGANDVGTGHPSIGNGQDISTLLGAILRIDVNKGEPYGIPPDNPFVGKEGADEIFAYGFRNPFRISFDAGGKHSLFAGDAGQNLWEEVDIVIKGGNYGWNIKEGAHCFDPNNPGQSPETCPGTGANGEPLIDPVLEYKNSRQPDGLGRSVIGGFVYRGNDLNKLKGTYIFGDFSTGFTRGNGTLLAAMPPSHGKMMWSMRELQIATSESGRIDAFIRSFGQDADKELYVLTSDVLGPTGNTGKIFKIVPDDSKD